MSLLATKICDITIEGFMSVLIPTCIIIMIISYLIVKAKEAENDRLPIKEGLARVIDIHTTNPGSTIMSEWIMFEMKDGSRVRVVHGGDGNYVVGDEGYLTWQGNRLVSFELGATERPRDEALDYAKIQIPRKEIEKIMMEQKVPFGEAEILAKKQRMNTGNQL